MGLVEGSVGSSGTLVATGLPGLLGMYPDYDIGSSNCDLLITWFEVKPPTGHIGTFMFVNTDFMPNSLMNLCLASKALCSTSVLRDRKSHSICQRWW